MLNTKHLNALAEEAGVGSIRVGPWLIGNAEDHFDAVMQASEIGTLRRLRLALTSYANPRLEGLTYAATAVAMFIGLQALIYAAYTYTNRAPAGTSDIGLAALTVEVLAFAAVLTTKAFATNARRRVGLPWLYLLDQRIEELAAERRDYTGPAVQNNIDGALIKIYSRSRDEH